MTTTATLQSAPPTGDHEIDAMRPWFHNLHLPGGRQTSPHHALGDFPKFKWDRISPHLPRDLTGWRALDVGCNAGFYTFELAKRGAHVIGIDLDDHYLTQARWAAKQLGLERQTEFRRVSVYESHSLGGTFDIIWFMGVLYHLRHPLLALDMLASMTRNLFVFQSLMVPDSQPYDTPQNLPYSQRSQLRDPDWPGAAFIEHRFAGDPTNWWAPNLAGAEAMLRSVHLQVVAQPEEETLICAASSQTTVVGQARVREIADALSRRSP